MRKPLKEFFSLDGLMTSSFLRSQKLPFNSLTDTQTKKLVRLPWHAQFELHRTHHETTASRNKYPINPENFVALVTFWNKTTCPVHKSSTCKFTLLTAVNLSIDRLLRWILCRDFIRQHQTEYEHRRDEDNHLNSFVRHLAVDNPAK